MATISGALDALYAGAQQTQITSMRQFLGGFSSNADAASALAGTTNRRSKDYKSAIRNVQRYNNYIRGERGKETRNPDNIAVRTMRRLTSAEARAEARRRGIRVKSFRGKIKTSPKRARGKQRGEFEVRDYERQRVLQHVQIGPELITTDLLDGDVRAFSDAVLTAFEAGPIGELYDIDELELEFGDGNASAYPY